MVVSVKIQNPIYILYHQSANMSESTVSVSDIDGWIFYRFHDRISDPIGPLGHLNWWIRFV